ncbi:hypothetical protein Acr_00g0095170 [Actinidia rufa]|uniref:Uncharacterized protein n=1 Tax=Actinidia rufa TaxID=165716 RepID=A0A7J0DYW7_9ERIC|nr:hypothetical protein Acr_00g0095170 [Actinidia rufa]
MEILVPRSCSQPSWIRKFDLGTCVYMTRRECGCVILVAGIARMGDGSAPSNRESTLLPQKRDGNAPQSLEKRVPKQFSVCVRERELERGGSSPSLCPTDNKLRRDRSAPSPDSDEASPPLPDSDETYLSGCDLFGVPI